MSKYFDIKTSQRSAFFAQEPSPLSQTPRRPVLEFHRNPDGLGWELYRAQCAMDTTPAQIRATLAAYARAYEWYSSLPKRQLTPAEQACLGFYQGWTAGRPAEQVSYLQAAYDLGKKLNDEL